MGTCHLVRAWDRSVERLREGLHNIAPYVRVRAPYQIHLAAATFRPLVTIPRGGPRLTTKRVGVIVLRVCVAGATGWAGSALSRAIAACPDLALVSAVSRAHAGQALGEALHDPRLTSPVFSSVDQALSIPSDVLVEYTKPNVAKGHILTALERGVHVVVGTSGLADGDLAEIDAAAQHAQRAVLACGNFALTAVLLQRFAEMAAKILPTWEIIDYAHAGKVDAPSGTVRELAARLERVGKPHVTVPVEKTIGPIEARGANLNGSQVHSLRLPSFVISAEVIFGMPDQRLSLRHDSGNSAEPYVEGALLAIRRVGTLVGLHRGLDKVLDL